MHVVIDGHVVVLEQIALLRIECTIIYGWRCVADCGQLTRSTSKVYKTRTSINATRTMPPGKSNQKFVCVEKKRVLMKVESNSLSITSLRQRYINYCCLL